MFYWNKGLAHPTAMTEAAACELLGEGLACRGPPGAVVPPTAQELRVRPEEVCGMLATTAAQDYSILIADDDGTCREALRDIMEPQGFRTLLASSGEEVIDIVRGAPVHLVLLDMHMPTLTGLETLYLLRQINALLPAILVTGDPSESVLRQASQAHVYSVIPKPVSKNVVLYTVLKALARFYGQR
jgi:CheY-like chemotaxis protein